MPKKQSKAKERIFTNDDLVKSFFMGIDWGISDAYSSLEISSVDVFSLPSLQKVATLKINK